MQSSEPLQRDIFIQKLVAEFEREPNECVRLLKTLCGLRKWGGIWNTTFDKHHHMDLEMTSYRFDHAPYHLKEDGNLIGLSRAYVDDLIQGGNK